uniref:Uncharacterized protein n=1 Tax=Eutreptiella gymnastica TaxID=73025 RepID=A0A7S4FT61_9EUGL
MPHVCCVLLWKHAAQESLQLDLPSILPPEVACEAPSRALHKTETCNSTSATIFDGQGAATLLLCPTNSPWSDVAGNSCAALKPPAPPPPLSVCVAYLEPSPCTLSLSTPKKLTNGNMDVPANDAKRNPHPLAMAADLEVTVKGPSGPL